MLYGKATLKDFWPNKKGKGIGLGTTIDLIVRDVQVQVILLWKGIEKIWITGTVFTSFFHQCLNSCIHCETGYLVVSWEI